MNSLHIKTKKKQCLIAMLKKIDKMRYHSLYLCSCYFDENAARNLINEVLKFARLDDVQIYIDRRTAIQIGSEYLKNFCESFSLVVPVNIYAVEANGLFHSKTYSLVSYDDGDVVSGSIVFGSANLTGSGLTKSSGNIECLVDSQDIGLLHHHLTQLYELKTVSLEEINKFSPKQTYSFKYALLNAGIFVHKWNENLEQYLSIRYQLSKNGKKRITDESLEIAGFNLDTATISQRYFQFDYTPPHLENTKKILRNYGIETYLGYWLPYYVSESMFDNDALDVFKKELEKQIEYQRTTIEDRIKKDYEYLLQHDLIEKAETDPLESYNKKLDNLINNDLKLKRIYRKYHLFTLPFDIQQKAKIIDLFDEMINIAESRKRKNLSMKALIQAYENFSIEEIEELSIN